MNFRKLRSLTTPDDTLIALLTERPSDDAGQSFSYSRTDISLCETFARLVSRLKAVPALFAVVEEVLGAFGGRAIPPLTIFPSQTDQPIKICDERNVVQYVNKAYETSTGKKRSEMLGKCSTPDSRLPMSSSTVLIASGEPPQHSLVASGEKENLPVESGSIMATSCPSASNAGISGSENSYHSTASRRRSSDWHCIAVSNSSRWLSLSLD